ncbi:hypothetical protein LCGC14_0387010 [marine sediment metagenome]|uniref:Uncharacterized protein n=1 Tax=marine sediment metagenome TaxID=412755 RepID=A0A0F9W9P5_9ZZZZ
MTAILAPRRTAERVSVAWIFGWEDGANHNPFAPEALFGSYDDHRRYTSGFLTAQPSNWSAQKWFEHMWQEYVEDTEPVGFDPASEVLYE